MKQKMGYLSVAYAAGLFFASYFPWKLFWCGILGIAGFLLLLFWKGRFSGKAALVLLAAFLLSSGWYYSYTALVYNPVLQHTEQVETFTGIVTHQTIYASDRAGYQVKGTFSDGTKATILCYTQDYGCQYGDQLTITGTLQVPNSDYLFSGTEYYRAKGIFLQADSDAVVTHTPVDTNHLQRALLKYRTHIQKKILRFAGTEDGGMMIAMLFGQKQFLDDQVEQAFFESGIGHVLSVSGFHMVLLLMPLGYLGKNRFFRLLRLGITTVLVGLFTILTEAPVSILRAGCMILLSQSGTLFYRKSSTGNALAISFILLTLPQPYLIQDASFLLSVSGTFGIGVFAPYMTRALHPHTMFGRLGRQFLTMLLVFLCTLPVSCHFFSETSLLSPITNVVLMPFCSLILICTVLVALTGGIPATFFAGVAMVCCEGVTKVVLFLEQNLPVSLPINGAWMPVLLTLVAILTMMFWCWMPRRKILCFLLCGQCILLCLVQTGIRWSQRNTLFVSVLGRRAEAVVLVQYGETVDVFDLTGHYKNPDYVQTYLQENSIHQIQTLALLDNIPQMEAAYQDCLSAISCEAVLIPSGSFCRTEDRICGQTPQKAASFRMEAVTENAYEVTWDSSALRIVCAGREITITLKAEETAIREAQNADFTLLTKEQQWMFVEQRGTQLANLLQSDDLQLAITPDGQVTAKTLDKT